MKPNFQRHLRILIFLPFLVLGFGWMYSYAIHSNLFWIGVSVLFLGLFLVYRIGKKGTNLSILISFTVFAYLTGEGITYLITPSIGVSGFNQACTEFDPIRGYRWLGSDIRNFKTHQNEVVYDNHFYPNNQGWIMEQEYTYKKKDSTKTRWMMLGDSFVAGIMLETNLPNRAQQILNDSLGEGEVELYSFGVDGGGIMNWYNVFFKEIIPNYEFDGLIIAPYADNLYRDFMVMLLKENGFMGRIDVVDWSEGDSIHREDFKALKPYDNIYTDVEIDQLLLNHSKEFDWPFKKNLLRLMKSLKSPSKSSEVIELNSMEELNRKMGSKKSKQLDEIITWCKLQNKELVLASIPSIFELKNELQGKQNHHRKEMGIIAVEYQIDYFDGYSVYKELNEEELNTHWLKFDAHWNQKGSDRYAESFAKYLMNYQKNESVKPFE